MLTERKQNKNGILYASSHVVPQENTKFKKKSVLNELGSW